MIGTSKQPYSHHPETLLTATYWHVVYTTRHVVYTTRHSTHTRSRVAVTCPEGGPSVDILDCLNKPSTSATNCTAGIRYIHVYLDIYIYIYS